MAGGSLPVLELGGISLGLRESVVLLIVLVTIYMVFVLLRMRRLRQPPTLVPPMVAPALRTAEPSPAQANESMAAAADDAAIEAAQWENARPGLADDILRQGFAQELAQLRDEVDSIRGELAALRADLQQEVAHLHSAQSVSPIYGDAMQMAVAGYDPVMIADRCGIARAEAELVVALAKSQGQ